MHPLGAGRSPTDELGKKRRMTQFILRPRAVQSIWLLSFKSIETFIAAIILLLISFLGIVIKSNTYNIIFLGICFLYSVALGLIMFLLFLFFELPMIYILVPIMNFIVLVYMLRKYGRR